MSPVLPVYGPGSISGLVPAILGGDRSWLPEPARAASQVVLLVIDGLGWNQLMSRRHLTPTLSAMDGVAISSVAPSTTATALTSITTGLTPGEHGIVGYRMWMAGEVLNVLRWSVNGNDARSRIAPASTQPTPAFMGLRSPVVARTEFVSSGFTAAHLADSPYRGWRMPSVLITETVALLRAGEKFVYAYYDGIDKVAHEYGLGAHYDTELCCVDALVATLVRSVPSGAAVVVTADHGQVDVGRSIVPLSTDVAVLVTGQSGEGRFRWLHTRSKDLAAVAKLAHGHDAWVVTKEQVIDEGWFGPTVSAAARARLGDVALVARNPVSFHDGADSGPFELVARHCSLTSDEMLVPMLAATA